MPNAILGKAIAETGHDAEIGGYELLCDPLAFAAARYSLFSSACSNPR
jgi:hypothetical protein